MVELNYKTFGRGEPLIILHGLLGTLDNWQTVGKQLAKDHSVYLLDQRNHGRSPHSEGFDYQLMANDLLHFLDQHFIHRTAIMGHSMGGKTAMEFALQHPDTCEKLIVVDIAPKTYPRGHDRIFEALFAIDLDKIENRTEAEAIMEPFIPEAGIRLFLLKNLQRKQHGGFEWKMNLDSIYRHYEAILQEPATPGVYEGPALFIAGANSGYIQPEDHSRIKQIFPAAEIVTIANAGHWVHAEQPRELIRIVREFLAG